MAHFNIANGLPSPAASARSPASVTGMSSAALPTTRTHPLKPGSSKEVALINYVDDKVLLITRRYAKKFSNTDSDGDRVPGYTDFDQVVSDLEPLFDVVWISGTPSLQVPYLLSLAGLFGTYMRAFPLAESMFRLARKFDLAFSSLLTPNEGPSNSRHGVSITEKVRIKSLVEDTRINAVRIASESGIAANLEQASESEDSDGSDRMDGERIVLADGTETIKQRIARRIGKIYELTLTNLGDTIGSISIPAMSDDAATIKAFDREHHEEHDDEVIEL